MEEVEGVDTAAGMLSSTNMLTGETSATTVSLYVLVDEDSDRSGEEICNDIEAKCKDLDCTVDMISASSISSYTSALGGTGVGIEIYSNDTDALQLAAKQIGEKLERQSAHISDGNRRIGRRL